MVAAETTVSPGRLIITLLVGFDASTLVMYDCNVGVSALTDIENAPKSIIATSKNAAILVFIITTPRIICLRGIFLYTSEDLAKLR